MLETPAVVVVVVAVMEEGVVADWREVLVVKLDFRCPLEDKTLLSTRRSLLSLAPLPATVKRGLNTVPAQINRDPLNTVPGRKNRHRLNTVPPHRNRHRLNTVLVQRNRHQLNTVPAR